MRLLEVKRKVIVVYGGGFQPFHQGHMSSYEQAKAAFPTAKFFVAASNDVKTRPIPFEAKKFLATQAGVNDPIVQVKQPINPKEILANFDPEVDILVLVRSERDPMAYTKKDGSPGYYQPWQGDKSAQPFGKNGYIFVTKKHDFHAAGETVYSGSQVRQMYAEADEAGKNQLIHDLYPHATDTKKIKQIFDQYLSGVTENINEESEENLLEYLRKIHKRWAIVSKKEGRPLVYFKGEGKPSPEWVERQERRIKRFKRKTHKSKK